jgi:hypothetical protein
VARTVCASRSSTVPSVAAIRSSRPHHFRPWRWRKGRTRIPIGRIRWTAEPFVDREDDTSVLLLANSKRSGASRASPPCLPGALASRWSSPHAGVACPRSRNHSLPKPMQGEHWYLTRYGADRDSRLRFRRKGSMTGARPHARKTFAFGASRASPEARKKGLGELAQAHRRSVILS